MSRLTFSGSHHKLALLVLVLSALALLFSLRTAAAQSPDLVISQAYGGGGNSGSTYTHDFIEIFNRGDTAVSTAGYSVQYASASGSSWQITPLATVTLQPGQYFLVQQAQGAGGTTPLPTPDTIGSIPMGGGSFKVALVNSTTALTGANPVAEASVVDFVGAAANAYEGTGAAPAPSAINAVMRAGAGCTDTDDNASDFTAAPAAPRNSATALAPCGPPVDLPPTVVSTTPRNGKSGVALDANIEIVFSEPVFADGEWFTIYCTNSGYHLYPDVNTDDITFTINPQEDFFVNEECSVTIHADLVTDYDGDTWDPLAEDYVFIFNTYPLCTIGFTPIGFIQGSGESTPMPGYVETKGVVTADYQGPAPTLRGFYMQDVTGDGNPNTSDGIFVFTGDDDSVNVGDLVFVEGTAEEFQGQTQISEATITHCGTGAIAPVDVVLPMASPTDFERYEGMLVRLPQTLYVTEHFQLGRFNQVVVSAGARLVQPTHAALPGAAALALQAQNNLNRIILDDALNSQNPDPITFGRNGAPLSASNTLRGGDAVTAVEGIMTYTWAGNAASGNAWRVRPTGSVMPNFLPANPRPAPILRTAPLRVTGLNLLNFFNNFGDDGCTGGVGGGVEDCRGADNPAELDRQIAKLIPALLATNADIIGISEIENDGYGADSALQLLVDELNAVAGADTWAFTDVDAATGQVNALGTDAIKVGILYKPAVVTPVGTAALNSVEFVNGGDDDPRNRPALAQTFRLHTNNGLITVVSNHLKSKSSACDDADTGDGQGNCAVVRTNAANALTAWLATYPTGVVDDDVLILGDLNSYAMEDPITALKSAGYVDLATGDNFTYVFDGQWGHLDYALASASLALQVVQAVPWHINADEPNVLDYNMEFKSADQLVDLYAPDQFRVSDHDPVMVDVNLEPPMHTLAVARVGTGSGVVTSPPGLIDCGLICEQTLVEGTVITLTATADAISTFAGWSGDVTCAGTALCVVTMDAAKNVTATFTLNSYALTVTTDGTGSGMVTNVPTGSTFSHGTVVTLTATADIGSTFAGWSGDVTCAGTGACIFTMDSAKNVNATFTKNSYALTVSTEGTGFGTVASDPAGSTFAHGTVVTLTATADVGSTFSGWSGDVTCVDVDPCLVTMDAAKNVVATFTLDAVEPVTHTLAIVLAGTGSGVVTSDPTGDSFLQGTVVTLTATANVSSTFTGWSGDVTCTSAPSCVITMDAAKVVTATFALESNPVIIDESEGGTILVEVVEPAQGAGAGQGYPDGTVLRITAIPDEGNVLLGWTGDLAAYGTQNPIQVTVNGPLSIGAVFGLPPDVYVYLPTVTLNR